MSYFESRVKYRNRRRYRITPQGDTEVVYDVHCADTDTLLGTVKNHSFSTSWFAMNLDGTHRAIRQNRADAAVDLTY